MFVLEEITQESILMFTTEMQSQLVWVLPISHLVSIPLHVLCVCAHVCADARVCVCTLVNACVYTEAKGQPQVFGHRLSHWLRAPWMG